MEYLSDFRLRISCKDELVSSSCAPESDVFERLGPEMKVWEVAC